MQKEEAEKENVTQMFIVSENALQDLSRFHWFRAPKNIQHLNYDDINFQFMDDYTKEKIIGTDRQTGWGLPENLMFFSLFTAKHSIV